MIEIVEFERPIIGFRENNAVVYASIPPHLSDSDGKQYAYEQIKDSMNYEQLQEYPSINGSEMDAIETFIPESPKVIDIRLIGDNHIHFEEGETERTLTFEVEAIDQYGKSIQADWVWTGAIDGVLSVSPTDENLTVTVSSDVVTASIDIVIYPHIPYVNELEELTNYVLDVDFRLLMVEMDLM